MSTPSHHEAGSSPLQENVAWLAVTAALNWLPLPSLVLASDGTALGANEAWAVLSAALSEPARGDGWLGVVDPLDRGPLRERLCEAAAVGQAGCGDIRLAGLAGGWWSRWWWRPGPAGRLLVCVADLGDHQPRDDGRWCQDHGLAQGADAGAADVAGMVVHRLFGVGLTLQSAAGLAAGPVAARLQQAVDELDVIIRDVRTAVFRLQNPGHPPDRAAW